MSISDMIISDPSELYVQILVIDNTFRERSLLESFEVPPLDIAETGKRKTYYRNSRTQVLCIFYYETKEDFLLCLNSLTKFKNLREVAFIASIVERYPESIEEFINLHTLVKFYSVHTKTSLETKLTNITELLNQLEPEIPTHKERKKAFSDKLTNTGDYDEDLLTRLKLWRNSVAKELEQPAYIVMHNSALENIAEHKPSNIEELLKIKGIGKIKAENYGETILTIVNQGDKTKGSVIK